MNRRDFLHRASIIAAGAIAADQLELLERLTHKRRFFPGADFHYPIRAGSRLKPGQLVALSVDGWVIPVEAPSNAWGIIVRDSEDIGGVLVSIPAGIYSPHIFLGYQKP